MVDYESKLCQAIRRVKPSGIRKFFDISAEMEDVVSLSIGEPDFTTPEHIRNVGIESLKQGHTKYTANKGITELRECIAEYYCTHYDVPATGDETLVTVGGSEALDLALRVLVEPGDEVLIPEPCFVCYSPLTMMRDGVAVPLQTRVEDEFKLTPELLKSKITPKSKILLLAYPSNPTGGIMEKEDYEKLADIIIENDLLVISDEIYATLTYGGKHHFSIALLPGMKERTIIVNGFSKAYAMTGWRLGYAIAPLPIIKEMTKLHQYGIMSAPTTAQYAAIEALKNGDPDIVYMRDAYDKRRRFIVDAFNELGMTCFEPRGAFYCFPSIQISGMSSDEFCEQLIQRKHVAIIPGTAFGACGEGFARVSYCNSMENLEIAVERIAEFLSEIR